MLITYLSLIRIEFLEDMVNSISVENKNPYIVGVKNLKMDSLKSEKIIIQTKIIGIIEYFVFNEILLIRCKILFFVAKTTRFYSIILTCHKSEMLLQY